MSRKCLMVICLMLMYLMPLVTVQAESEQVVFGGDSMENATTLGYGINYSTQYAGETRVYFKIVPNESERISMTFFCTYFPSAGYMPSFSVLDETGKEIGRESIKVDGTYYQITVTLQRSQIYYIELFLGDREALISFALCSKTLHPQNTHFAVSKQPSCTDSGEQISYCEFCGGTSETKDIPALGHTPGDWRTETKATCATEGTKVRRCTVCNSIVETETLPMLEHTPAPEKITVVPVT